jgi:hypothetical protein
VAVVVVTNPRVLKAHREAVRGAVGDTLLAVSHALGHGGSMPTEDDLDFLAGNIAFSVLCADDTKTRYVVLVREPNDTGLTVFGPYATADAAQKALDTGAAFALVHQGALARIYPLTPSPKAARVKKSKTTSEGSVVT